MASSTSNATSKNEPCKVMHQPQFHGTLLILLQGVWQPLYLVRSCYSGFEMVNDQERILSLLTCDALILREAPSEDR
ncbi:hypothetical protein VTN77DRAFT_9683 [Rasamsonia byssochlamydoides]|uniref:uncharacterized protein n=1 Tax=Rasamsonia byssochlamydoides TaxID=89139 RepID=UPI00374275FD